VTYRSQGDRPRDRSEPLVSVIVPFFNTPAPFLREAVESVFSQSYDRWEMILVDDGSAGECTDFARDIGERHGSRVRYLDHPGHENRGLSAARMLGVSEAKGDYIAFLDSDDVWLPTKLREQVALMEAHPEVGMSYGNALYWHSWTGRPEDKKLDHTPPLGVPDAEAWDPPRLLPLFLLGEAAVPCTCSLLVRRDTFDRAGGFEPSFRTMYEDQVFYSKVCLTVPVLPTARSWSRYRQHAGSMCARESREQSLEARAWFLRWLGDYLTTEGVQDEALHAALREARLRNDAARATGLEWVAGEVRRRIRKWSRRLAP
jgi:glycosyltransferase involved in cell wall biosynthesis